ncbi:MAG: peptidoglycan DD-metalloendopeptidase family protein [Alphaproteobacteria bacterium]|nr:peptidoglycan DD-metalloendopeptidase family protein [Alphaproteobacteria bacterium]
MILRARRRRVPLLALILAALLAGCQNVRVKLGEPATASAAVAPAAKPSYPNPGDIPGGQVTIRRGETIYDVSQRTGAPVRDLIDANHLRPPYRLAAGRTLIVPRTPTYVVRHGDTLYSIAEGQGVELYSLARMNELTPPFAVTPGQVLKLPPTVARPLAPEAPPPSPPSAKPAAVTATQLGPAGSTGSALPPPRRKPEEASLTPPAQTPAAGEASLPEPPPRGGRFIWPVQGRIIGRYGTTAAGTHNDGINIAAPKGAPVRAADAGVVAYAGNELRGYGNLVLIKHAGGWMTAYAHNGTVLVHRGEVVKRGQEIATVGATGIVSEPQLHFEIRKGIRAFDPTQYLSPTQASERR